MIELKPLHYTVKQTLLSEQPLLKHTLGENSGATALTVGVGVISFSVLSLRSNAVLNNAVPGLLSETLLLLLMLWTALSVSCAQTQLCSSKPVAMTVADSKDAAKLAKAALCDNAIIKAVWQGNVQLAETIVVGNGTSLTVTGASAQKAIIDGGNAVQLFN
eukprot:16174-Heterococcus_DN1.PRE.1